MNEPYKIRKATLADLSFLVEGVIAAESPLKTISLYEKLFDLERHDLIDLLKRTLSLEIKNHSLSFSSFYILEVGAEPVALASAWIEESHEVASSFKTAIVLSECLGLERWMAAKDKLQVLSMARPARTRGALQLEYGYTPAKYRGKGYLTFLVNEIRNDFNKKGTGYLFSEISFLNSNFAMKRMLAKLGYREGKVTHSEDPLFREMTGSSGFIQLTDI